jgi:Transposase DDE domain
MLGTLGQTPISVNLTIAHVSVFCLSWGMLSFKDDVRDRDWTILTTFLPPGWAEMARTTGALRRVRDFPDAETLLRTLLLHVANGYSLAETAVRARQLGVNVSPVAIFKRLRASEEWLRWLAEQERGQGRVVMESQGRPVRAVDATTVSEPGSTGTDWRVHYAINLTNLQCDFFEVTDVRGGETLRRVPVHRGDIVLGDRIYATPVSVAHVRQAQADIVVRLNRQSLPLFDLTTETALDVLGMFRQLKVGQVQSWNTRIKQPGGGWIGGRIIAIKRSATATRKARRRLERKASKAQKKVSRATWIAAQYFAVWTSLPETFSAGAVLEMYRMRWQIELAFKRMKSILGLGHLPKKDPASAHAWLHGKIFVSLLVERMVEAANSFSPWGYRLSSSTQPVEGD